MILLQRKLLRNSGILTCFSYFSAIRNPVADGTLSRDALAKMGKNEKVSPDVIERICCKLHCRIEEVIVYDENAEEINL